MTFLDTHVVIWLYKGHKQALPERADSLLQADDELLISPIVLLELENLHEIRRLTISAEELTGALRISLGLQICTYPFGLIMEHALREKWTRDPFDRIIVAHARAREAYLISHDEIVRRHYSRAVW